jgi:hypothetical protein
MKLPPSRINDRIKVYRILKYVSSGTLSIFLLYFKYRYTFGLLCASYIYIYIYIYIPGDGKCVTHEVIVLFNIDEWVHLLPLVLDIGLKQAS